jgi:broad specificity phosphatase PhoE
MRIYVARHTQTNYNVETRLNSDPSVDVQLTELGIMQAQGLAQKLAQEKFEVIYISELPRTKQTAEYVNKYRHSPTIVDKRLNDNATGFEGRLTHEYLSAFHSSKDGWHTKFHDGESLADARNRAESFLNELKTKPYEAVLVITHNYIVESIYGILYGLDYEEASAYGLPQGEFAVFDV